MAFQTVIGFAIIALGVGALALALTTDAGEAHRRAASKRGIGSSLGWLVGKLPGAGAKGVFLLGSLALIAVGVGALASA